MKILLRTNLRMFKGSKSLIRNEFLCGHTRFTRVGRSFYDSIDQRHCLNLTLSWNLTYSQNNYHCLSYNHCFHHCSPIKCDLLSDRKHSSLCEGTSYVMLRLSRFPGNHLRSFYRMIHQKAPIMNRYRGSKSHGVPRLTRVMK